jgi:hypothetical protein
MMKLESRVSHYSVAVNHLSAAISDGSGETQMGIDRRDFPFALTPQLLPTYLRKIVPRWRANNLTSEFIDGQQ